MNYINIRKSIQNAGDELYHRLGETSRNLQYLAGEIMAGNEEYVRRLKIEHEPLTIKADDVLKDGFSVNQKAFLIEIEKELQFYKKTLADTEDRLSLMDDGTSNRISNSTVNKRI